jgi:signal peptidase I
MTAMMITLAIVGGALAGGAVRRWLAAPVRVESRSMEPTLRPGQRLLVRPLRGLGQVARGDVVVADSPAVGRVIVKRAIGLPGERIDLDRDGGVCVDGRRIAESYARRAPGPAATYDVPAGNLFLLGDNRPSSSDSRTWREPFVPAHAVLGKVIRALR